MEPGSKHPYVQTLLKNCEVFAAFPVTKDPKPTRDSLPVEGNTCDKSVVWTILKENIGKDLWSITMPVQFNEPLSVLQRTHEQLEYSEMLRMANKCMDPCMRLALVFGSVYIMCSNIVNRLNKTFNPLLGETYEWVQKDLRSVMEQVSHHPPISAFYSECNDFIFEGCFALKTMLKLTSFKIKCIGQTIVRLKATGETFVVTRPVCRLHNYIVGKMYGWFEGPMECVNENTGDRLDLEFKKKGWTSRSDYVADGQITDAKGKKMYLVEGLWNKSLDIIDPVTKEVTSIVKRKPEPPNCDRQFGLTAYAINLNHLNEIMLSKLCPTDSRLRPDLRAYEFGNIKMAAEFKERLEVSQRARRKANQEAGSKWKPLWFELTQNGDDIKVKYLGQFWKAWETGNWPPQMLDLYN